MSIVKQPDDPDTIARRAGIDLYGSSVGDLRRSELARLLNAWNLKPPVGATKDEMLAMFAKLELANKNPRRPPDAVPIKASYSDESRAEVVGVEINPMAVARLREKLMACKVGEIRKLVKELGLPQRATDKIGTLVDKIIEFKAGELLAKGETQ